MKEVTYKQFIAGVEQERIRMGGELHDNIGSKLSHFKFTQMKNGIEELETIIDDVRSLSRQLAPPFAQTDGLLPLLKSLIERTKVVTGIEINLQVFDYAEQFNQEQIIQLYRTFQELLNNLTKHSKAKTVDIQVLGYDNEVVITMDDDGIGFDMSMAYQGFGLNQLKIRAGLINGKIDITSTPGQGTHIILEVPISLKQNSK